MNSNLSFFQTIRTNSLKERVNEQSNKIMRLANEFTECQISSQNRLIQNFGNNYFVENDLIKKLKSKINSLKFQNAAAERELAEKVLCNERASAEGKRQLAEMECEYQRICDEIRDSDVYFNNLNFSISKKINEIIIERNYLTNFTFNYS